MRDARDQPMPEVEGLQREAEYFHQTLFGRAPTVVTTDNYVRAHLTLPALAQPSDAEQRLVQRVVNTRLDAVGIEPWLRHGGRRHLLSAKLLLLAYLGECDGRHPEFARSGSLSRTPWRTILGASFHAGLRLVRARLQLRRHGLL